MLDLSGQRRVCDRGELSTHSADAKGFGGGVSTSAAGGGVLVTSWTSS
jgi:hypothetical protein